MNNLTYHKATLKDLQILIDTRIDFLLDFWGTQPEETIEKLKPELRSYFTQTISDDTYVSFIAKNGDTVTGVGGMIIRYQPGTFKNPGGKVAYIMSMYTVPEYRRKGIAGNILKRLLEEGEKQGVVLFELHATKDGQQVYPKFGFKLHTEPTYRKYAGQ